MTQNIGTGAPAPVQKNTWLPKVLIGCGVALLVFIIACAVTVWFVYRKGQAVIAQADQVAAEFVDQGFVSVKEVPDEAITEKTVIRGGAVELGQDSTADVAIVAGTATVSSHIGGTLYFRGLVLEIAPGAVIDGDLDLAGIGFDKARVRLDGTVKGKVTGSYELTGGEEPAAPASETTPEAPVTPAAPEKEAIPAGQSELPAPEPVAAPAAAPAGEPAPAPAQ